MNTHYTHLYTAAKGDANKNKPKKRTKQNKKQIK